MRLGARLKEDQNCGIPLTSVAGGLRKDGMLLASAGSCGPGSASARLLVTFIAPSGGRSGLPNEAACAADAATTTSAALTLRRLRRENSSIGQISIGCRCPIPGFGTSFGGQWLGVAGGRLLPLLPEDPGLQPVEVDIDDRRRVERQNLRQKQAADDGVAERLAKLRADPSAHHHRHATE